MSTGARTRPQTPLEDSQPQSRNSGEMSWEGRFTIRHQSPVSFVISALTAPGQGWKLMKILQTGGKDYAPPPEMFARTSVAAAPVAILPGGTIPMALVSVPRVQSEFF